MKRVFTYYEPVSQLTGQLEQIDVCRQSWERHGWQLDVIGEDVARKSEFYPKYAETISLLPSVNPGKYDYHCYMRWLAMSTIGGVMIDYDVVNINLTQDYHFASPALTVHSGHVPCTVSGSAENYLRVCHEFCRLADKPEHFVTIKEKPHTSDMFMLKTGLIPFSRTQLAVCYPAYSQLIHCSNEACHVAKKPRLEIMKSLLDI